MIELDYLRTQARRCRALAGGLSNREDVRTLEELAREFEDRARLAEGAAQRVSQAAAV